MNFPSYMADPIPHVSLRPRWPSTRPRKALVEPAMRLADFYEGIGRAAYDQDWVSGTRPVKTSTRRTSLTSLEECAAVAADDLAFALQSGTVRAAILLDLPEPKVTKDDAPAGLDNNYSDNTNPDELSIEDVIGKFEVSGAVDDDIPTDEHRSVRYLIKAEFWDSAWREDIDWQLSQLYVPARFILASTAASRDFRAAFSNPLINHRPDLQYQPDQQLHGPIIILSADQALGAMFRIANIPSAEVNSRYLSFRNRLIDEVIAAAWRWLAIQRGHKQAVGTRDLIQAMTAYLEGQGVDAEANKLGEKGLEALARQVLNERRSSNCSSMVLKNTSPPKAFKASRGS